MKSVDKVRAKEALFNGHPSTALFSNRTGMSAGLSGEKHVWACKSDLSNRHAALKWALLWSPIRISSRSGWYTLIYAGPTSLRLSRCSSVTGLFMEYRPGNGKMLCQVVMIRTALCKAHRVMQSISGPKLKKEYTHLSQSRSRFMC